MKALHMMLAAAAIFAGTMTASAQFMGGSSRTTSGADGYSAIWAGYAPTTFKYSDDGSSVSEEGYNTFSIGWTKATPLQSSLLGEYGVFADLTYKKEKDHGVTTTETLLGVKVPVNVLYALPLGEGITLYPYAGLNGKLYLLGSAKAKYEDESVSTNFFSKDDMGDEVYKRFTIGYQIGLRAGFGNYFASIGYTDDITKIADYTTINKIEIGVGMLF